MKSAFKTVLMVIICLVSLSNSVKAQTEFVVPVGGIAITSYDFDNSAYTFVCLTEIPEGTIVLFTVNSWATYTNLFREREGVEFWDDGCYVDQVIIVTYQSLSKFENNKNIDLSNSGDQIFIYQENSDVTPHFIFGLNSDGVNWLPSPDIPGSSSSNLPVSLAGSPYAAIAIPEKDRGYYQGSRSFKTTSEALTAITTVTNWKTSDNALTIPTGDFSFETTAVELSHFDAKSGNDTPPLWVLLAMMIVPVGLMLFKRPKRDCCG